MDDRPPAPRPAGARVGTPSRPGSLLQRFLDGSAAYAALPRRHRTPAFHLEPLPPPAHAQDTEWYYLCDDCERIGLVETWKREIEMFRFLPAGDGGHNPLHLPTDDVHAQGFVGFVTEPEVNPFVELLETSEPVFMVTCSQWYDQHILMRAPPAAEADGRYRVRARDRFLSLPGVLARELEATAVPNEAAAGQLDRIGFLQGKVNDFEAPVPRHRVYNGPLWSGVDAADGVARSGRRSICLTGMGPGQTRSASPIGAGPGIYGESAKWYRLAAWVKTRGLQDGGAWLQVDDVRFSWQDVQATRRTEALGGDRDWTRLELDFTPAPHDPFLLVKLCVQGTGAAWFDDLELVELAR